MGIFVFSFLLGTVTIYFFTAPAPWFLLLAVLMVILISMLCCRYRIARLLSGMLLGFFSVMLASRHQLSERIPLPWQQQAVTLRGQVIAVPQRYQHYSRFLFRTHVGKQRLLLRWYGQRHIEAGDQWQLRLRIHPPINRGNPAEFDKRRYFFFHGIAAEGYVVNSRVNQLLTRHQGWRMSAIRARLAAKMVAQFKQQPLAVMLPALTVGDRHQFSDQQWQVLKQTGTAHLMAISGLHIGLVAGLVFISVKKIWVLLPRLPLYLPAPLAAAWIAIIAAVSYSALAGFSLPTDRALIMLLLMFSARIAKRFLAPWQGLLLALLIMLLWQPLIVLSAGFWLSFGAVATILYLTWGRVGKKRRRWEMVRLQWGISLAMIPLTLIFFQQGSLIAPLVNLLAIPWVGWIIVPLALLGCIIVWLFPFLGHLLWWLAIKNLQLLWLFLTTAANFPGSHWQQMLSVWQLLLVLLAMLLLLAPRGVPARYLGIFILLPALFVLPEPIAKGDAKITMLDSRYGEAITVQTQHHSLLFITPNLLIKGKPAMIINFMRTQRIKKIDNVIIADPHHHHSGCMSTFNRDQLARLSSLPWQSCHSRSWRWQGVKFALTVSQDSQQQTLLKISAGGRQVFITTVLSQAFQHKWAVSQASVPTLALLVASTYPQRIWRQAFIAAMQPQWIISAAGNKHSLTTLWSKKVLTPHTYGALTIHLCGKRSVPHSYRLEHQAIWS